MANGCRLFLQDFDKTGPGQSRRPLVDLAHELGVPKTRCQGREGNKRCSGAVWYASGCDRRRWVLLSNWMHLTVALHTARSESTLAALPPTLRLLGNHTLSSQLAKIRREGVQ